MDKITGLIIDGLSAPQSMAVTRFAPSPNGRLHVGHAYSALCAHDIARRTGGAFYLRIEDIDGTRSRTDHVDAIMEDMAWLGLRYDGAVQFQSQRVDRYQNAFDRLQNMGLLYRCWCTRSEIVAALKQRPVRHGPDGPVYPGTCRGVEQAGAHCWRLDMAAAVDRVGALHWTDLAAGNQLADPSQFGDVIIWRKDAPASYHLASVVDDAADGMSHIVRGMDLFAYTAIHRLLQQLLLLPEPVYWHHPLLLDASGEKLAKSRLSQPLSQLRNKGMGGAELVAQLRQGQLPLGISVSTT